MVVSVGSVLQGGKYRLEALLGQGGFGTTYKAAHVALNELVVIKTLTASASGQLDELNSGQRLIQEAQRLAQFQHPHIVRVRDCFLEQDFPFIVMDYILGPTLAQKVASAPLPEAIALQYIGQIGQALSAMHHRGLLHRDVKPSNILLREDTQTAVLIDFGIAKEFTGEQTQTNTGILSEGYAPPEQYLPRHTWTPAIDIYGLAATLYTLVTGRVPVASILRDRVPLETPAHLCPQLSSQSEHAILRGMALDASARSQTVDDWLALLPLGQSVAPRLTPSSVSATAVTVPVLGPPSLSKPAKRQSTPASRSRRTVPPPMAFPLRALAWSAAIAGTSGLAFGFAMRIQYAKPLNHPNDTQRPDERAAVKEESFPPKPFQTDWYGTAAEPSLPPMTSTVIPIDEALPVPATTPTPPLDPLLEQPLPDTVVTDPSADINLQDQSTDAMTDSIDLPSPLTSPSPPPPSASPSPTPSALPSVSPASEPLAPLVDSAESPTLAWPNTPLNGETIPPAVQ